MLCKKTNTGDNIMENIELFEKMKSMPKDELIEYMGTVKLARNICNVIGISTVLLALTYTNIFVLSITGLVLWGFGQLAVGADVTQAFIVNLLETKFSGK